MPPGRLRLLQAMIVIDPKRPFEVGPPFGGLTQSGPQLLPSLPEEPALVWIGTSGFPAFCRT
jgi:hypothetical protein